MRLRLDTHQVRATEPHPERRPGPIHDAYTQGPIPVLSYGASEPFPFQVVGEPGGGLRRPGKDHTSLTSSTMRFVSAIRSSTSVVNTTTLAQAFPPASEQS